MKHKIVRCSLELSNSCKKEYTISDRELRRQITKNGSVFCLYCSRELKNSERKNPNKKYNFNDSYLDVINTPHKAYLLGWIASDGHVSKSGVTISVKSIDEKVLCILKGNEFKEIPIFYNKNGMVGFKINSKKMSEDVCRHLNISPGKKSSCVKFPKLKSAFNEYYIRGYFEGDGSIHSIESLDYPSISISSNSIEMLDEIRKIYGIPGSISKNNLEFCGVNALDFLSKIYKNSLELRLERKYISYIDISLWQPSLSGRRHNFNGAKCTKTDKNAVYPKKERASDSGYDITIIKLYKKFENGVEIYDSGLKIKPPFGFYFDLVPRSSFYKTGYILVNSIGVIDGSYCGNLMAIVKKIDKDSPDLEVPGRYFQIIPREIKNFEFDILTEEEWNEFIGSERGDKGFGSSGR